MPPLISIILMEPENPDNIGAVARAMKNMGLQDLRLVSPPKGWKIKGKKLAMSATDVLRAGKVFKTLAEAIADCGWVIGTTQRTGVRRGRFTGFEQAIQKIKTQSQKSRVGILFGKESKGLDNASLNLCDSMTTIPSHEAYPSLNLSQAVMVMAFSVFSKSSLKPESVQAPKFNFCTKEEILDTLGHFENALKAIRYEKSGPTVLKRILATFYGIFKRNGMLEPEAQMIKGLSRRIIQYAKKD